MGESGSVSVHHDWLTVELSGRSAGKLVFLDILVPCLQHPLPANRFQQRSTLLACPNPAGPSATPTR